MSRCSADNPPWRTTSRGKERRCQLEASVWLPDGRAFCSHHVELGQTDQIKLEPGQIWEGRWGPTVGRRLRLFKVKHGAKHVILETLEGSTSPRNKSSLRWVTMTVDSLRRRFTLAE